MARRHHYTRRSKQPPNELDVTTFLNLMVVLIPFLLITAVFSRITIVELTLPTSSGGEQNQEPAFRVEVIVREGGLEIGNGKVVIAAIPKTEGEYDLDELSRYMISLKEDNPDTNAASVLLEPTVPYDYLIRVMDVVRSVQVPGDEESEEQFVQLALFTEISVGDAP
jgi:biopolymer transport protein ExbD